MVLGNALTQMNAKSATKGKYDDGQGLWLFKSRNDAGKWILRVVIHGKRREMGLGRWPDVSIAEARGRAEDARRQVRDGIDPIEHRTQARRRSSRLTDAEAVRRAAQLWRNRPIGGVVARIFATMFSKKPNAAFTQLGGIIGVSGILLMMGILGVFYSPRNQGRFTDRIVETLLTARRDQNALLQEVLQYKQTKQFKSCWRSRFRKSGFRILRLAPKT